jgi:hypothetical protein
MTTTAFVADEWVRLRIASARHRCTYEWEKMLISSFVNWEEFRLDLFLFTTRNRNQNNRPWAICLTSVVTLTCKRFSFFLWIHPKKSRIVFRLENTKCNNDEERNTSTLPDKTRMTNKQQQQQIDDKRAEWKSSFSLLIGPTSWQITRLVCLLPWLRVLPFLSQKNHIHSRKYFHLSI